MFGRRMVVWQRAERGVRVCSLERNPLRIVGRIEAAGFERAHLKGEVAFL